MRYPYSDPGQPGSGDIGVYAEGKEETAGGQKFVRKGAGKDDGFQWGSSFEKARQQKIPVKRVQQTWQAKKPLVGKGVVLPDLPKGAKGREEGLNEDPFMGMTGRGGKGGGGGGSRGGRGSGGLGGSRGATPVTSGWGGAAGEGFGSRPTTEERGGGELWGGLDVKAGGGGSGEVVKSNLKPIKGGGLSLRG